MPNTAKIEEYFEDYTFLDFLDEDEGYGDEEDFYEEEKERKTAIKAARKLLKKLVRVLVEENPETESEFYKHAKKVLEPGMERIDFDSLDIELFKDELMIIAEQFGYDEVDVELMCD